MRTSDFFFELPPELIAQEPRPRGTSRMLVVEPGLPFQHRSVSDFPDYLQAGDLVVVNDTRVVPARLFAEPKGAMTRPIEILLTEQSGPLQWDCWAKPARRVHQGDELRFSDQLSAMVVERSSERISLRFVIDGGEPAFWTEIERIGIMPLPPYIRRPEPRAADKSDYQTIFADRAGAIAAPTAGLHFTAAILEEIGRRGAELVRVTLHVGIGTFAPVKVDDIAEHRMHKERYEISAPAASALNRALESGRRIIAIGTTSVRTLESAIRSDGSFHAGGGETDIFITPGFRFRAVSALLTNFHLPESTLLMLVSAFAGAETIREAYRLAVEERYRFFSYGDCMFLRGGSGVDREVNDSKG